MSTMDSQIGNFISEFVPGHQSRAEEELRALLAQRFPVVLDGPVEEPTCHGVPMVRDEEFPARLKCQHCNLRILHTEMRTTEMRT
jgi:hypothetical protein